MQTFKHHTSVPVLSQEKIRVQWSYAKQIVQVAKYPVDKMVSLWSLLTQNDQEELSELIKLAQIALTLPLHTAGCERVFSQQNLILTKQRSRLSPVHSDRLVRIRMEGKGLSLHDFDKTLKKWHDQKRRILKTGAK